jgi:hypothetical protein
MNGTELILVKYRHETRLSGPTRVLGETGENHENTSSIKCSKWLKEESSSPTTRSNTLT